jgi:hypothetical protein
MQTLQIETTSRWDALALVQKLPRYRWYLVEPDRRRWDVRLPLDESVTSLPADLRHAVRLWLRERHLESASIRIDGRTFEVGRGDG